MLNAKVIGIGAAGNKAAIALIENGVIAKEAVVLLNTTLKDVPAAYKDTAVQILGAFQGCAKERDIASQMIMDNLRNGKISLDGILTPEDKMVIIVTSLEGGTGCGASTVLARYFSEVLNAKVHLFGISGFEEDARGMKNTVDWFKELSENYIVECISNKKFLKENFNNKLKAEKAANEEFVKRIRVLLGKTIVDSDQNIDDADLYKLTTTPGFMTIETVNIDKVKNGEALDKAIMDAIDNSKSLDVEATCKRIGVIVNVRTKTKDSIDGRFEVLRQRYGEPFEFFTHIQDVHEAETVTFVVAGLKMPTEEIEGVYSAFLARLDAVDNSKDAFFGKSFDTAVGGFDINPVQLTANEIQSNKANFFGSATVKKDTVKTENGTAKNISISDQL